MSLSCVNISEFFAYKKEELLNKADGDDVNMLKHIKAGIKNLPELETEDISSCMYSIFQSGCTLLDELEKKNIKRNPPNTFNKDGITEDSFEKSRKMCNRVTCCTHKDTLGPVIDIFKCFNMIEKLIDIIDTNPSQTSTLPLSSRLEILLGLSVIYKKRLAAPSEKEYPLLKKYFSLCGFIYAICQAYACQEIILLPSLFSKYEEQLNEMSTCTDKKCLSRSLACLVKIAKDRRGELKKAAESLQPYTSARICENSRL